MKFGIYCNNYSDHNLEAVNIVIAALKKEGLEFCTNKSLSEKLNLDSSQSFSNQESLAGKADVLISIGGDGTILSTVNLIYGTKIPIVGVNTGRLGYLTSVTPDEFDMHLREINSKNFEIEKRSLLEIESNEAKNHYQKLALNEVAVLKKDTSAMIAIKAFLDGELLNTYWADGLIISTPTGSTAYSLSCGGPILAPGSGNFIITPIAPHNLNARPLVIPDTSEIELSFETRSKDLMLTLDLDSRIIADDVKIKVKRAEKTIGLLRSKNYSYLETLRSKLNWGLDKRN